MSEITYRALKPEEYDRLKFIFEPRHLPLPDPLIERVAVAEEDGKIIGMAIQRLLPLIDGLWVEPKHRGDGFDYKKLGAVVEETLATIPGSRAYMFVTGKSVAHIAEICNYKPLQWRIFEKVFR